MYSDDDLDRWLQALPLDEAVEIDGESVYLKMYPNGAELGAYLAHAYTYVELRAALRLGFSSAIKYDAGLGLSADGNALVLAQWLPQVRSWSQAVKPLESLLNQVSMWRAALAPEVAIRPRSVAGRNEQRLRTLFAGVKA